MLAMWLPTAAAAQEAPSFQVGARVQGWYQAVERGAPDASTAHDFMIRRGYVYLIGRLPSHVSLFAHVAGDRLGQQGLDTPGLGLGTGLALRDAWIAWEPVPAFRVQFGRMYVPFTRAFGTESTFTQLGVDLPASQGGTRGALFYTSPRSQSPAARTGPENHRRVEPARSHRRCRRPDCHDPGADRLLAPRFQHQPRTVTFRRGSAS